MADQHVRSLIATKLDGRLKRMGITAGDLADDLDLVRSGVLDSLGFVDLIADLENATGMRIDLENALGEKDTTTMRGVLALFQPKP